MKANDSSVELHVFGCAKGESLVLRMPTGLWGVVDCYTEDPDDPTKNAALTYLRRRRVKNLDFVCLTHPHDDHYRGILQLLEAFQVREFWQPAITDGAMLRRLIVVKRREATRRLRGRGPKLAEDTKTLEALYQRLIDENRKKKGVSVATVSIDTEMQRPGGWPNGISVKGVGPSGRQWRRYQERLARCFDTKDRFIGQHGEHNLCSVGLRVQWKEIGLLLGGDILSAGWKDAIERCSDRLRDNAIVKMAHHGSRTGRCEDLWRIHSAGRRPVSVVTGYRRGRSNLPEGEVLEEAMNHSKSVFATDKFAYKKAGLLGSSTEVLRILHSTAAERTEVETGRCSFQIHLDGSVKTELEGGACQIHRE